MLSDLVARATVWAGTVFYRVERYGASLPDGPMLIVANHPNMLMDPLLALHVAGGGVRPIVKAPHLKTPLFGQVLRGMRALAVYRLQDDPQLLHKNKESIREAVDALRAGETLLIFPEGGSGTSRALRPLKAGAARMALTAEAEAGWRLGLKVVPLGFAYHRKHLFRSRVAVGVAEPLAVSSWRDAYEAERPQAIRSLTDEIGSSLRNLTLNLASGSDREPVETAELVWARAKGVAGWRERQPYRNRLPRLQRFAQAFSRMRHADPERFERLTGQLRTYRAALDRLRSGDADVPPRKEFGRLAWTVAGRSVVLLLSLPVAALGTITWYLPYFVSGLAERVAKPPIETVATVKLLAAIVAFPAAYLAWMVVAASIGGPIAAALTLVLLPPLGFAALAWQDRFRELVEDVRLLQMASARSTHDRLAELRATVLSALEDVNVDLAEPRGGSATGSLPAAGIRGVAR